MTGKRKLGQQWVECRHCRKRGYTSRKAAKVRMRGHPERTHMGVYHCPHMPSLWHIGHKPTALIQGRITRDEIIRRTA